MTVKSLSTETLSYDKYVFELKSFARAIFFKEKKGVSNPEIGGCLKKFFIFYVWRHLEVRLWASGQTACF